MYWLLDIVDINPHMQYKFIKNFIKYYKITHNHNLNITSFKDICLTLKKLNIRNAPYLILDILNLFQYYLVGKYVELNKIIRI